MKKATSCSSKPTPRWRSSSLKKTRAGTTAGPLQSGSIPLSGRCCETGRQASGLHEPVAQPFYLTKYLHHGAPLNSLAEPTSPETGSILGLAPLLKLALAGNDLAPLANQWIERVKSSRNANTLLDLSIVLELLKNREMGLAIRGDALKIAQHFRISSTASETALK